MSLERKAIRREIFDKIYRKTKAGDNVTENNAQPNWYQDVPAINLWYDRDQKTKEINKAPRVNQQTITLFVEVVVDGNTSRKVSDNLDDICDEIEVALSRDDSLDCLVDNIVLNTIEFEFDAEGERLTGAARMTFDVEYVVDRPRDQGRLDDLNKIVAEYDQGDGFSDEIDIPTT